MSQDPLSLQDAFGRLEADLGGGGATQDFGSLESALSALDREFAAQSPAPAQSGLGFFGDETTGQIPNVLGARARAPQAKPDMPGLWDSTKSAGRDFAGMAADAILAIPEMFGRSLQRQGQDYGAPAAPRAPGEKPPSPASAEGIAQRFQRVGETGGELVDTFQDLRGRVPKGDPRLANDFLFGELPRVLGQVAGGSLAYWATGPGGLAASSLAVGSTSLMNDVEATLAPRVAAGEMTEDEARDRAWTAFSAGLALAVPDAISLGRILGKADKATGGALRRRLAPIDPLKEVGKAAATEGLQEFGQTGGEILTYDKLTDQERSFLETLGGAVRAGKVGAAAGAIIQSLLLPAMGLRRRQINRAIDNAPGELHGPRAPEGPQLPKPQPQAAEAAQESPAATSAKQEPPALSDGELNDAAEMGFLVNVQVPEGNMEGWRPGISQAEIVEVTGDSVIVRSQQTGRGRLVPKSWLVGLAESEVTAEPASPQTQLQFPEADTPAATPREELDAALGPVRTPEEVRADEVALLQEEGDRVIREALSIPEGEPLPDLVQAPPGLYDQILDEANAGGPAAPTTGGSVEATPAGPPAPSDAPAQMPTEQGLFGPIERDARAPAPDAGQGQAAAATPSMFDEQAGDLPGQGSLLEAAEETPTDQPIEPEAAPEAEPEAESGFEALEAQMEAELEESQDDVPFDIPEDDDVPFDIPPEDAVTSDTPAPLFLPGDFANTELDTGTDTDESDTKPSRAITDKMRTALQSIADGNTNLHHKTIRGLTNRGLIEPSSENGSPVLTLEGRRVLEGRTQRKQNKSEAARARRDKVLNEVLQGIRGFRDYVRAMGGLAYEPELWMAFSAKESGEKTPIGFSPVVHRKGSGRGASVTDMATSAIEDGLLPGINSEDVDLSMMIELLDSDYTHPRAERIAQEKMEAYYAEQQDMLSELYRQEHGDEITENQLWGLPRANPTGSNTNPPAHPALPFPTSRHGQPGTPTARAQAGQGPKPGKPISKPQIQEALAQIVKAAGRVVPIRIGHLPSHLAGAFKLGPTVIRVREAFNLTGAAHEVFHALEYVVYGFNAHRDPWTHGKSGVSRGVRSELSALGKAAYGNQKPPGGYPHEGWAEFGRLWIFEQDMARTLAPKTTAWFESKFLGEHPEIAKAISNAVAAAERWEVQGPVERGVQSMVDPNTLGRRVKRTISALRYALTKEAWIDMGAAIQEYAAEMERLRGSALPNSQNPWAIYSGLRGTHDYRARQMIDVNMVDLNGMPVGPSLKQALAPVRGERKKFTLYLWARQAQLYWNDPNNPGGRDPGLSLADADAIVNELGTPKFELAENMIRDWHEGVLNYAAQGSPAFAEVVARIRQVHPGYLMPLQRHFEELDNMWARAAAKPTRGGVSQNRSPVQRMMGSGRRVREPFQDMAANARLIVLRTHQRMVTEAAIKGSRIKGMGRVIEKLEPKIDVQAERTIKQLVEEIEKKVSGRANVSIAAVKGVNIQDLVGETIAFFAPTKESAVRTSDGGYEVPYWNGKTLDHYWIDAGLYEALGGMDAYYLPKWADMTLGATARAVRMGATGINPAFGLLTNVMIDLPSLWLNSQSSANGGKLLTAWLYQATRAGLSAATGGKIPETPEMQLWMNLGGPMANSLAQDTRHTRRSANKLFEGPALRTVDPRNWVDFIRDVLQFPESASRVVEISRILKERGIKAGDMIDLDTSLDLLLAGKGVTTDFSASGKYGRVLNQMTPYFNAAIQGPRAHWRAARHHPGRFMFRAMQLTVLTLFLWKQYKDEDWYNELPPRERFGYWHFKVGGEIVRIRRPFEVGAFFASLPEALLDGWYRRDPKAAMEWFENTIETVTPPVMPALADEILEQARNRDSFSGAPIVPKGELEMPPEDQYGPYTSKAARVIGQTFEVSPRRVDHAIRGTFAGGGQEILNAVGLGAETPEGYEDEPSDVPIAGRLFLRGGTTPYRPESVDQVWERLSEYTMRQRSRSHEETPLEKETRLQLADAAKALSALYTVRAHTKGAGRRRSLSAEIIKLAREALEDEENARIDRSKYRFERKRAEQLEEVITGQP